MLKKYASLFVILSGCLWGTMGLFVRIFNNYGFSSIEIVSMRCILTSVFLFIYIGIYKPDLLKINIKDLWCFAGAGILSLLFFNYCYFKTITLTNLSVAAILLYTSPIFVMILSLVIFGEKITTKKFISLIMVLVGCSLVCGIIGGVDNLTFTGIITGLCSGFGYSLYSIFTRFALKKDYSPITTTAYTFLFASIGCMFLTNFPSLINTLSESGFNSLCLFILYAFATSLFSYILYATALQYIENTTASVIVSIEPVVATIIGIVVFKETLTIPMVFGIILVIGALGLLNINYASIKYALYNKIK